MCPTVPAHHRRLGRPLAELILARGLDPRRCPTTHLSHATNASRTLILRGSATIRTRQGNSPGSARRRSRGIGKSQTEGAISCQTASGVFCSVEATTRTRAMTESVTRPNNSNTSSSTCRAKRACSMYLSPVSGSPCSSGRSNPWIAKVNFPHPRRGLRKAERHFARLDHCSSALISGPFGV